MKKLLMFLPTLVMAFEPVLVGRNRYEPEPLVMYSLNNQFHSLVSYGLGNSEFVPFDQFILQDKYGKTIYSKNNFNHTVVDIADNGFVVGSDFDGPISGKAILHFYDRNGVEQKTAAIDFLGQRAFSVSGNVYCVMDGINGLRVFKADGSPLYNLGKGNIFAVSLDGSYLALAKDQVIVLFSNGTLIGEILIASPFIRQIKFSKDGSLLCFIDRKNIFAYRVKDQQQIFKFEETRPERNLISCDIATDNITILAGLDEDYGRNSALRHQNGYVYLFNTDNGLVWSSGLRYATWDISIPEVRFDSDKTFWIRTDSEIIKYSYRQ